MSDLQTLSQRFAEDGYVVLPGAVAPELAAAVYAACMDHYAPALAIAPGQDDENRTRPAWDEYATDVLPWVPGDAELPAFAPLTALPEIVAATRACAGDGYIELAPLVMLTPPGGQGQAWHQDCPPVDPAAYNVNRLVYPADVLPGDGAIVVVPGSHRSGLIPAGGPQESLPGEIALEPKAGTVIVLHGHVFHRVTPSASGRPRLSVNLRAFPAGVAPSICHLGVYRNAAYDFTTRQPVPRTDPRLQAVAR